MQVHVHELDPQGVKQVHQPEQPKIAAYAWLP